ncbi:MAG: alcohol dehydrogenase catalytic domain-containing protein [Elusimicrobia bacterium]|nr:alcohol dehydrogenase catalytic domain-containing protein [Elusimicrobiota bacterium]
MKAIHIAGPGTLELGEAPSRPLRTREVRIAVASTCVCGSDLRNIGAPALTPQVPGHEFSGMIVELSAKASATLKVGDHVTAFPMRPCFECPDCLAGRLRDCENKLSLGFQLPGSLADEVIVDSRLVVPLADGLTYEQGALVEHLCCGYRLAKEFVGHRIPTDSHSLLVGDGPIALADLQALRLSNYREITLIGKHPARMALAEQLGATRVLDAKNLDEFLRSKTLARVDACVMAAPAEQTLQQILPLLKPRSMVFPQTRINDPRLLRHFTDSGIKLGRAFAYDLAVFSDVMALIKTGKFISDRLITKRVDLLDFAREFTALTREKTPAKIAVGNNRFNEVVGRYRKAAL